MPGVVATTLKMGTVTVDHIVSVIPKGAETESKEQT